MRMRSSSDSYTNAEKERERMREKEREKRYLEWKKQQELQAEHEKLKRKKIEEYERKRAEQLAKVQRSSRRSRNQSRSRSRSEESHHRSHLKPTTSKSETASEKHNLSQGSNSFFRGPEDTSKINAEELKLIKVTIHRKVPAPTTSEIRYKVLTAEEVIVKRRDGNLLYNSYLSSRHCSLQVQKNTEDEDYSLLL